MTKGWPKIMFLHGDLLIEWPFGDNVKLRYDTGTYYQQKEIFLIPRIQANKA